MKDGKGDAREDGDTIRLFRVERGTKITEELIKKAIRVGIEAIIIGGGHGTKSLQGARKGRPKTS